MTPRLERKILRFETEEALEEALSRPSAADVKALAAFPGDVMILGVGGKMGPSLARLARRASDQAGLPRRILGVSRFSEPGLAESLHQSGIETLSCDLLDRAAIAALPEAPHIIFMAARKFGSTGRPSLTWAMNTLVPAMVAERFPRSRLVSFSTGNVYPLTAVESGGPDESCPADPVGEYGQSCLGRERLFEYFSETHGTLVALLRLNYAIEPRYGVLREIADRVWTGAPVDLAMGHVNVIWQRDAISVACRALAHCQSPPLILNLTGPGLLAVRNLAIRFGELLGREPVFTGSEAPTALLNNASQCHRLFGPPETSLDEMLEAVAHWVQIGGRSFGKATHYEQRAGKF